LDEAGYQHYVNILPNDSIVFNFKAVINNLPSAAFVNNIVYAVSNGQELSAEVNFAVQTPTSPVQNIPPDTLINCSNVPFPPFQDTCLQLGPLSKYAWDVTPDSEYSAAYSGDRIFDADVSTYWLAGVNPETGCSVAYASSIVSSSGVGNPNNALGAPDGAGAQLYDQSDEILIDLGAAVSAGNDYTITWRQTSANPLVVIFESPDGIIFYPRAENPVTVTDGSWTTQSFTANYNTQYIRIATQNVFNLEVDAVAYDCCCTPGAPFPLPHSVDIDLGEL